jgi:hypothetical protein
VEPKVQLAQLDEMVLLQILVQQVQLVEEYQLVVHLVKF